ncbi:SDR family oxidoreductase [Mangrovimicrobium sediminis]|uniref:SDR family oxidoreductase n=1 Tax=Mangrovimicrobium sediminis TaxID=2562682 RepID=A0A4Z0M8J8_9GAMM|nr:SDR family oxidoreductase [Haliea sp. SAOS-164]TGD75849.1 SDR family oxidoreductase [Haliea sp. SAOS-164]
MSDANRTALVTGAAGGIGRAACERLAHNGWQVLAVDRDTTALGWTESVAGVTGHVADITSAEANKAMIAAAEQRFGGLDAVLLNAAIPMGGSLEDVAWEDFEKVIGVNLMGTALGMRAALPALRRRGGGAILATASTHGLAGECDNAAYVASKHAVIGLVRAVARDVGCEGIRVNAICPGLTRQTGMTRFLESGDVPPEVLAGLVRGIPLQRCAEADEMAAVMEFLVSPAASYINGVALPVDGGAITGSGLLPPKSGV